ncbi:PEP-CTERM sorting domain-containing protein [Chamaesiphon sp. OTE_20_metabat_361]|uniref:PEP-CTERM sorting domain-containing protein n=1 Tax=Chamaesiphon sp. OTE_20_metabat_361 TaxID=2964689 RepID=UPI00286B8C16|nr:PEP-CTERM sorting domain-containing protein [Chamaesiphon sp. OTE_20_metabat_361]
MDNKVSFATAGLVLTAIVFSAASANAVSLTIPTTTVNGTDVFSGPSFTVTSNFLGTDTISLDVSGTVDLASGGYTVNAAGVLIQGSTFGDPAGGARVGPNSINFGALLLGNTTIGFRQLFLTNAGNGLGNSAPQTNLSLTDVSLSSIFGSGLNSGTVLQFRVNDSDFGNNSGGFTVSTPINQSTTAVPEPFTIIGTLIGSTAAVRMRKKLKAEKA